MGNRTTFGYARPNDGAYIGYRVDGEGSIDIVWQPDWPGNIDMEWQHPLNGSLLRELSSFARIITHDHRGVGLSSRNVDLPTLEMRVSDLLVVLRATGTRRPVLVGVAASGAVHALLAATRPGLPRALVWLEPSARFGWAPDYPWGSSEEERELERGYLGLWGTDAYAKTFLEGEEAQGNPFPPEVLWLQAAASRNACTPDVAAGIADIWYDIDVRGVLGSVNTPTLLLFHEDRKPEAEVTEYVASRMPAAEIRAMPGLGWTSEEMPAWAEEIRDFVGVQRPHPTFATVLSTVLFTDIVGSTERLLSWVTEGGVISCKDITGSCATPCAAGGVTRTTRRAMASTPPSTVQPARCVARWTSHSTSGISGSRSELASTRESAS
jgi:pimeloyl-ACP methyl ester carboxylesterase